MTSFAAGLVVFVVWQVIVWPSMWFGQVWLLLGWWLYDLFVAGLVVIIDGWWLCDLLCGRVSCGCCWVELCQDISTSCVYGTYV